MFTLFAVILTAGMILLTLFGAKYGNGRRGKHFLATELLLSGLALIMGGVTPLLIHKVIYGGDGTGEWMDWAWDAFVLFVKTTLPFTFGALLLMIVTVFVTVFSQKKQNIFSSVVRQAASVAVSVVLLFLASFYSAMAETDGAEVHMAILVFGVAEALLMRLVFVCERAIQMKRKK